MPRLLAVASLVIVALTARAQPQADLPTRYAERGKQVLADDFAGPALAPEWKPLKGKWEVAGGAVKGTEKAEDQHAAVIRRDVVARDLVVQFSFRFDGGKSTALSFNDKKGHVCRVGITPAGFSVARDKPTRNSEEKQVQLDRQPVAVAPGEWHTMVVEIVGKTMVATLDGKTVAFGSHDAIDGEKTNIGFPVSGDGVSLKAVRVWEAAAPADADAAMRKLESDRGPRQAPKPAPKGAPKASKPAK